MPSTISPYNEEGGWRVSRGGTWFYFNVVEDERRGEDFGCFFGEGFGGEAVETT